MTMSTEGIIKSKGIYLLVKATRDGKPVVLKALKEAYRDKSPFRTLLRKEYDRCGTLDNPHLVSYLDFTDRPDHGKCIVMEHVDGRPLSQYLQEEHTAEEKLDIVRQICDGLAYLHGKNIMHRNLKASNVLVSRNGDAVRLIDPRLPFADDLHVAYSSRAHIAPEQKDGTVAIDGRADIFSLGVLMKSLALPAPYAPIIEKCTAYSRGDRYIDVDSLLAAIDGVGHASSSRKPWAVAAVAAAVIAAAAVVIGRGHGDADAQQPAANPAATETATTQQPAADTPAPTEAQPAPAGSATADLAFLMAVRQQMFKDIDKMFDPYLTGQKTNRRALNRQITKYYRGLLRTFGPIDDAQRAAYDKTFGDYVARKRQLLPAE